MLNSYRLETLDGQPVDGEFHARRLRRFVPREGTELAEQQEAEMRRMEEIGGREMETTEGATELEESGEEVPVEECEARIGRDSERTGERESSGM